MPARKPASIIRLGSAVRRERLRLGLSQERLAEEAGLHRNYVGLLERAEIDPTFSRVARIAGALGLRLGDLYRG